MSGPSNNEFSINVRIRSREFCMPSSATRWSLARTVQSLLSRASSWSSGSPSSAGDASCPLSYADRLPTPRIVILRDDFVKIVDQANGRDRERRDVEDSNQKGSSVSETELGVSRAATRVEGLDEVLHGGIPRGRTTLVSGGPGCGKSVLGLEFLHHAACDGEPGVFVTFEERADSVRRNARGFGWDLEALEQDDKLFLLEARVDPETIVSGEFDLSGLLGIVGGKAESIGAKRIVIDAIDVLLRLFDDPARERKELFALHNWLLDREMTAIMTVKAASDDDSLAHYQFLDYMVDCVVRLDQRVLDQVTTRRLRVIKYRGSNFSRNEYPYVIDEGGLTLIPISDASLQHFKLGEYVSCGHQRLDTILGGGYRRGACVLISGTSGTGKTTLASTFVRTACQRGEKCLIVGFEESADVLTECMLSPGIDLRPAREAGTLQIQATMPESMGAEEHLIRVLKTINEYQPDHVVVDSISSCLRMGSEQAAFDFSMRLSNLCKQRGITCILTNQSEGFTDAHDISGIGISSLVDAVIFLRYIDVGGEINRMLLVMKSRGTKHSNQYREFLITDEGIDIADVYVGEGGVLTGAARQEKEAKEAFEHRRRQQFIKRKEHEVAEKQAILETQTAALRATLAAAEAELEGLQLEETIARRGRDTRGGMRGEDANSQRISSPTSADEDSSSGEVSQ